MRRFLCTLAAALLLAAPAFGQGSIAPVAGAVVFGTGGGWGVSGSSGFNSSLFLAGDGSWRIPGSTGSTCALFSATLVGCVPASGGGSVNFLRADGVWAAPPGGGGGGSGTVTSITFNSPLTGGTITSSGAVGLGNVPVGNLGGSGGTPSSATFLRGDNTWATPPGAGGGVSWPSSGAIVVSNGTSSPVGLAPSTNNTTALVLGGAWVTSALPSCSGTNQALTYTTGTGYGCVTISGGGGSFSFSVNPGLTINPAVYNGSSLAVTSGSTISQQLWVVKVANNCTFNANNSSGCSAGVPGGPYANDSGLQVIPNASGLTIAVPAPTAVGTAGYTTGYNGTNSYTLASPLGGVFQGNCPGSGTGTATLSGIAIDLSVVSDGTNWHCIPFGGSGGGGGTATTPFPITWGPGQNLSTNPLSFGHIDTNSTVQAVYGRVDVPEGAAATIQVYKVPSGIACGSTTSGGAAITTATFNANGTANTGVSLTPTATALTAPIDLCITGTGFSSLNGSGMIQVKISTP